MRASISECYRNDSGDPLPGFVRHALVVYPHEHIGIYDGAGGIIDSPDWGRTVSHRPVWGSPIFIRLP